MNRGVQLSEGSVMRCAPAASTIVFRTEREASCRPEDILCTDHLKTREELISTAKRGTSSLQLRVIWGDVVVNGQETLIHRRVAYVMYFPSLVADLQSRFPALAACHILPTQYHTASR